MALLAGTRLGAYEIEAPLGAGGMGEVYRARDTRLNRVVAIKVLPPDVATDAERRGRLQREAQVVSSLNHPHICTLFDVGEHGDTLFLVMELVAGETLALRLARVPSGGGLPIDEALRIGHEVALALEAAHRCNVVHRDLKPANVMLTKSGVKLLDFGVAKLTARDHLTGVASLAITDTLLTAAGGVVGTLSYMAPEQLEGRAVDGRADIFAFGALIYEMLTGARAFDGASSASVIASILGHQPPPVSLAQPLASAAIDRLVHKCLAKDPEVRWQSATDLADELRWLMASKATTAPTAASIEATAARPRTTLYVLAALLVGALGAVGIWRMWGADRTAAPLDRLVRFTIQPPIAAPLNLDTIWRSITIAPDGSRFAYTSRGTSSGGQLMVRDVGEPVAQAVAGAEVVRDPFMSPDGQWVGFHGAGLQKISIAGGSPVTIVKEVGAKLLGAGPGTPRGASWGDDDQIVFATSDTATGLYRVAAAGGEPVTLTTPNLAAHEGDHISPSVLPGARGVLFTIRGSQDNPTRVAVLDYTTSSYKVIIPGASNATYVNSGHIVYETAGALRAAPFDLRSLSITGESRLLAERVMVTTDGAANYGISLGGTLVSVASRPSPPRSLVWVDLATGRETPVAGMPKRPYRFPRLSPDQTRIAVAIEDAGEDIWVWDFVRSRLTQVTTAPGHDGFPVWTPDGKSIIFGASRDARFGLYLQAVDGTGTERRLETGERNRPVPSAVTPDGLRVLFHASDPTTTWDLMDVAIGSAGSPRILMATTASENFSRTSSDGRYLAYRSFSANVSLIFVQPYPEADGKRWSVEEGQWPVWMPDGRAVLFLQQNVLKSIAVVDGRPVGTPKALVDFSRYLVDDADGFDLSADGKRVLTVRPEAAVEPSAVSAQIIVTLNALTTSARSSRP